MAKDKTTSKKDGKTEVLPTSQNSEKSENIVDNQPTQETTSASIAKEKLPDIEQKIALLKKFPDAKVIILSDSERGSLSNFLFSSLGIIDQARNEFKNVLNYKTEVENSKEFYSQFAEYSESYENLMKALKDVEKHSINLLQQIKKPSSIRSGMLRGMLERNKKQRTDPAHPPINRAHCKKLCDSGWNL